MSAGDISQLRLETTDALFLDFDGTLVDLDTDPDAVFLDGATAEVLGRVSVALGGALALISGRSGQDLALRTPTSVWRLGDHGLDCAAPGDSNKGAQATPPEPALAILRAAAEAEGVRLEIKGPVAALHYRAAPLAEADCRAAAEQASDVYRGSVVQAGKMVVEVKPAEAHKGTALRARMAHPPFSGRRPLMFGDDTTDEDAIEAAQALGGVGIKVGDGATAARFRIPDPAVLRAWLAEEASRLHS